MEHEDRDTGPKSRDGTCLQVVLLLSLILACWMVSTRPAGAQENVASPSVAAQSVPPAISITGWTGIADSGFVLFLHPPAVAERGGPRGVNPVPAGQVAYGNRSGRAPVTAFAGPGGNARPAGQSGAPEMAAGTAISLGVWQRFLLTGEFFVPVDAEGRSLQGRITPNSFRINASFRF